MKNRLIILCAALLPLFAFIVSADEGLDTLLHTGKLALDDKNYQLAEKKFKEFLKKGGSRSPHMHLVTARLAECYYGQKNYSNVFDLLGSGEDGEARQSPDGSYAYWRALAWYEMQEYERALKQTQDFEKSFADSDYQPRVLRLRGWNYMKQGNVDAAIEQFRAFDSRFPEDTDAPANLLDYSRALIGADKVAGAEEVLLDLKKRYPNSDKSYEGRYWLGQLFIQKSEWENALRILVPLGESESAPASLKANTWFAVAEIKEAGEDLDGAVNALSRGIEASAGTPAQREGRLNLGQLLLRMNRIEEGVPMLKAVIADAPTAPSAPAVQLSLSQALLNSGHNERAVAEFQNFLESFSEVSGQAAANQGKAWALYRLGRFAESATAFKKAAELFEDPSDKVEAHFKTGDALFKNEQFSLAAETYDDVYTTYTNATMRVQARYQYGECLIRLDQRKEAEEIFQALHDDHPEEDFSQRALLRLALLKTRDGDHAEALKSFEAVMKEYPESSVYPEALLQHGVVLYTKPLYDYPRALKDFDKIIEEHSDSDQVQTAEYMRGWCHYMMGRGERALELWTTYLETYGDDEDSAFIQFWIGEYLFNQQKNIDAERHFLAIASNYPEHELADDSLFWAAQSAARMKEYLRANNHCTQFVKNYASSPKMPEVRFLQGHIASELPDNPTAVLLFDEIIKKYPDHHMVDQARIQKGLSHYQMGGGDAREYTKAIAEFEGVLGSNKATREMKYTAGYEIGRCLVDLNRVDDAMDRFYGVMTDYQKSQADGVRHGLNSQDIFTRAAMRAADIKRSEKQWETVVSIYQRVVDARVPGSSLAKEKIDEIKAEHWLLF